MARWGNALSRSIFPVLFKPQSVTPTIGNNSTINSCDINIRSVTAQDDSAERGENRPRSAAVIGFDMGHASITGNRFRFGQIAGHATNGILVWNPADGNEFRGNIVDLPCWRLV